MVRPWHFVSPLLFPITTSSSFCSSCTTTPPTCECLLVLPMIGNVPTTIAVGWYGSIRNLVSVFHHPTPCDDKIDGDDCTLLVGTVRSSIEMRHESSVAAVPRFDDNEMIHSVRGSTTTAVAAVVAFVVVGSTHASEIARIRRNSPDVVSPFGFVLDSSSGRRVPTTTFATPYF